MQRARSEPSVLCSASVKVLECLGFGLNNKRDRSPAHASGFSLGGNLGKANSPFHQPKHFGFCQQIELGPELQEGKRCNTEVN